MSEFLPSREYDEARYVAYCETIGYTQDDLRKMREIWESVNMPDASVAFLTFENFCRKYPTANDQRNVIHSVGAYRAAMSKRAKELVREKQVVG